MSCTEKELAKSRKWREANREKTRAYAKNYYQENKDKVKAYKNEYHKINKDKEKEYRKKFRQENKERLNLAHKAYRKSNAEYRAKRNRRATEYAKLWSKTPVGKLLRKLASARGKQKRRERNRQVINDLTKQDVIMLLDVQNNQCAKCYTEFSEVNPFTLDHILPLSKGGGLTRKNTQLLCHSCNSSKGTKFVIYRSLLPDEAMT